MPSPVYETNGHHANGQSASLLGAAIENRRRQFSSLRIGSQNYVEGDEDDSDSWEDLSQHISEVEFLIEDFLALANVTGLVSQPKIGKSFLALDGFVKPVITGTNFFGTRPNYMEPQYAIWVDTERRASINMKRAKKLRVPLDRIKTPFKGKDRLKPFNIDSSEHRDRLFSVICRYKAPLVVIDSFRGSHTGDENSSRIQTSLSYLGEIAEETKAAILLIHHTKKLFDGEDVNVNSFRGSNGWLASIACQYVLDQPGGEHDPWRRIRICGENLGISPAPFGFRITDDGIEFGESPRRKKRETQKDKAASWLRDFLKPGEWKLASDVTKAAKDFGYSSNALQRAREEIGITTDSGTIREREDRKYEWTLPKETT